MRQPANSTSPAALSLVGTGSAARVWTLRFARSIAPRKHFRVLPTRTRPSLFGGD
jgi:hypothetical protein